MKGGALAAGLAVSFVAVPTVAAESGQHDYGHNLAAVAMQHVADCIYTRQQSYALEMLRTVPQSYEEERVGKALDTRMQQCFAINTVNRINFTWAALRGSLAEAAYRARYPTMPTNPSAADPYGAVPQQWVAAAIADPKHFGLPVSMHLIAACAVNDDPEGADKVIRTVPSSKAEGMALTAMMPRFGRCLNKDHSFSTDAPTLRAQIAEALYDRETPTVATGAR